MENIEHLSLNIYNTKNIKGGNYKELPFKTKAVINVKSDDEKCFLWSILAALHPAKEEVNELFNYKKYKNEIKIKKFPVCIKDIPKIEKDNDLIINVYDCKPKSKSNGEVAVNIGQYEIEPLYLSEDYDSEDAIDILYYKGHYMYLKQMDI